MLSSSITFSLYIFSGAGLANDFHCPCGWQCFHLVNDALPLCGSCAHLANDALPLFGSCAHLVNDSFHFGGGLVCAHLANESINWCE